MNIFVPRSLVFFKGLQIDGFLSARAEILFMSYRLHYFLEAFPLAFV
ncbi:hypothetical protein QG37_04029 [Candidozyma auris]|nr:hypothetical protein QG37_04029 [[Candida] auris]